MARKILFCEECQQEYTLSFKGKEQPQFCPFCGEEADLDWSASDEDDVHHS